MVVKGTIDKVGQRAAAPHYKRAKENPPEIRRPGVEGIVALQLTEPAKGLSMAARKKSLYYMDEIDDAFLAETPQDVVSRLHNIRQRLDKAIQQMPDAASADKADLAVAQNARNTVDDILKNRVPGFMEGDEIIHKSKKAQEDVDFGYDSISGGKTTMFPETFSKEYAKRDPKYVAEGLKGRIGNAFGTNANDTAALSELSGTAMILIAGSL